MKKALELFNAYDKKELHTIIWRGINYSSF